MGRIIQSKNGQTLIHTVGEEISLITAEPNTYVLGVDSVSGLFEKLDPNGTIISLESGGGSTFTGGTVSGPTTFTAGLTATTLSATTYLGLPNTTFTGGTVSGPTTFTAGLTATTLSATTYYGLPNTIFTGGTVTGATTFTAGLTATSISATTYYGLPVPIGSTTAVTYSEFSSTISGNSLNTGMLYIITDFQTCYDQPDFNYSGTPITTGNYKQGPVEPIIVLATSSNTISSIAYQPTYPNDKITYDWTWNTTEVTSGASFGRITERVDEFNNRTDYDHRNILFKRYRLFTSRLDQPLNGTIELLSGGTVNGTDTIFTGLTIGDVIYIPSTNPSNYVITGITDNITMAVSGDTITAIGTGQTFYKAIEETNDSSEYFSFKRTNVKTDDFVEYTTFGSAINNSYAKNTYVGNYANNYTTVASGTFILANNVFLEGEYESNKFGDYCYNNTFGTDNQNNIWGDWCYENVSVNDIDDCIIGHRFNRNLINANLFSNHIGNDFNNNRLLGENSNNNDFQDNIIGNGFNNNLIYSQFNKNEILDNFQDNTIGDFGNLDNFEFYRNYIRNNFNNNTIRQNFQNNQIGTNFKNNEINGDSQGNTILNGFGNNIIGSYFSVNEIGNAFNNNFINDSFNQNTTKYGFNGNNISNEFFTNDIGSDFQNNNPSNLDLFGWSDLSTVSTRTYDTFYNSLNGNFGKILGKELVMEVTSTSQYFKIKFTQWSTNDNGFQYTREEIDSSGNSLGPVITFTLVNGGTDVDYIVPGDVEITRSGTDPIYNSFAEPGWDSSVSPSGTSWNSIYTEPNNGEYFSYNKIGNKFQNNTIGNDFGFGGSNDHGNVINDVFENNTIGQFMYNNVIGNYFTNNTIGDNFENNTIKHYFIGNTIANNFESNDIGNYFGQNGGLVQNTIFNNFKFNKIGNFFGNELNFPTVSGGTGNDGGNIINDGFQFNEIGDNCIYSAFNLNFDNNKIGNNFWLNVFGSNNNNNTIGNLFVGNVGNSGFPSEIGDGFVGNIIKNFTAFNQIGTGFTNNEIGNYFGNAGTSNYIAPNFNSNKIGNYFGDDGSATSGENAINIAFYANEIGDFFYSNIIEEDLVNGGDFYSNKISSNFANNSVYANFNNNIIESDAVDSVDFLQYVGNISTYTLTSSSGGTDSSYTGLTGITNGAGINGTFDVIVSLSAVSSVVVNNVGQYYFAADTFVIDGALIGGVTITDDVTITIDTVTEPSVYGNYNCTIFKRPDGNNRLSFYDNSDVLNIKDINQ
jgi:hypothetical protein